MEVRLIMPSKIIIQNGVYELKDISVKEKFLPLMLTYIKINKRIFILYTILLIAILIYVQSQKINIINVIPYICGIIMILFFMLFAMSRLLIIKNNKKQYIKVSGKIIKLMSGDLKTIEAFDLTKNNVRNIIVATGNIVTIILESYRSTGNDSQIKCAITFPKECIEVQVFDETIINSIKEKENAIYQKYLNDKNGFKNINIRESTVIKDIIEQERQEIYKKHNINIE